MDRGGFESAGSWVGHSDLVGEGRLDLDAPVLSTGEWSKDRAAPSPRSLCPRKRAGSFLESAPEDQPSSPVALEAGAVPVRGR
jgi:hypothetical protein